MLLMDQSNSLLAAWRPGIVSEWGFVFHCVHVLCSRPLLALLDRCRQHARVE